MLIEEKFGYTPHLGPITALAGHFPRFATGSSDETLRVYDIRKLRELGTLSTHASTISAVAMPSPHRLLSAAQDGGILLSAGRQWEAVVTLKGHKGPITALSLHPSNKCLISASDTDRSIRTWNLLTGICVFKQVIPRGFSLTHYVWSQDPDGAFFALAFRATSSLAKANIFVFSSITGNQVSFIEPERQVLALAFVGDSFLAVGGEEGVIRLYEIPEPPDASQEASQAELEERIIQMSEPAEPVVTLRGHEKRVAVLASLSDPSEYEGAPSTSSDDEEDDEDGDGSRSKGPFLVSGSTDGLVLIWDLSTGSKVGSIHTSAHITSLIVMRHSESEPSTPSSRAKRQNDDEEDESQTDDDDEVNDDDEDNEIENDEDDDDENDNSEDSDDFAFDQSQSESESD